MRWPLAVALLIAVGCKEHPSKLDQVATKRPADAAVAQPLDEQLEAIRAKLKLPALAMAAWRDGTLLEIGAVGLRRADAPEKVTTKDAWHLGSNTKAMTATLIAIFIDRGTLRWDDTIATLFPGWKIDPGYAHVTIDQLLRHQGGAPGEPPPTLWKQLWADGDAPDAREKFVRGILAAPPAQTPGTFVYSNAGYMIAGAALEKVTGRRWDQLMKDELFAKLGMTSCGFGPPGVRDRNDQPRGHDGSDTPLEPGAAADNPPGLGPAGTIHCALEDYGKFLNLHALGEPALVTPESLQHLHTPRDGDYAGGWGTVPSPKGTLLMHSGSNTLWYATALVGPPTHFAFAIVTNKADQRIEDELAPLLNRYKKN